MMRLRMAGLAVLAALLVAGCGGDAGGGGRVTLKLADTVPPTDPFAQAEQRFAEAVAEPTRSTCPTCSRTPSTSGA